MKIQKINTGNEPVKKQMGNSNNRKRFAYRYMLIIFLILFFIQANTFSQPTEDIYEKINRNMDVFGKAFKEISLNYVDYLDVDKFMKAGIDGMFSTLDPYTTFYDESNKSEITLITAGKFGGIGLTIELKDSLTVITDILPGYEAERRGLRAGDIIREIDGTDIKPLKPEKIRMMVRGEPGTTVNFKIERNTEVIDFVLTRQEIILKNVSFTGFIGEEQDGAGYIKLDRFTNTSVSEFENSLKSLKSTGKLKGLIIDLRGNGGGLLEAAIEILNKIVPKNNLLLITKGREADSEEKFFSKEEPLLSPELPVIVLINKFTASASEIVAGAIQDLDRGVIIGTKSLGKGLVQQIKDISYGRTIKLTNKKYFTPSGRWIQEKNYFKENKYGVFINDKTYDIKEFKTLNGRTVTAYGGIMPDIEVSLFPESEVYKNLLSKDAFFKFVNYYLTLYPDTKSFKCNEEEMTIFEQFLKENDIFFTSAEESKLKELEELTKKKSELNSESSKHFDNLREIFRAEGYTEFENAKAELKRAIELEMYKRLFVEEERIKASFSSDIQLESAINLLRNLSEYNKILNKNF